MISHAQGGRMDEQRCSLQPNRSTPVTPTHNGSALNNGPTGQKNTEHMGSSMGFLLRDTTKITFDSL